MIIVNLKGGLGNQMFQYACGRALSLRRKDILKLDVTGYGRTAGIDTPRQYALKAFNIDESFANSSEINNLKYPLGIFSKGWRFVKAKVFRQYNVNFSSSMFDRLNKKSNVFMDGFWQTEKYFSDQADTLRKDFTLRETMSSEAQRILEEIKSSSTVSSSSISLHIRRGDYVSDKNAQKTFSGITLDYYKEAVRYIENTYTNQNKKQILHIFLFSDDIEWVRQNLSLSHTMTFVSLPPNAKNRDAEEIVLMSSCDHNIIANSSFSWWGAWLNQNPSKIIVAPKVWSKKEQWNYRDIIPTSWIRI